MGSELLNAVTYIKNISKKKVTFTKIEAFMRKKELLTCKDLDNRGGEMEKLQFSKLATKSRVLKHLHHLKVLMTAQKTLKKTTYSRIKTKIVLQMETFKYHSSMTRVQSWRYNIKQEQRLIGLYRNIRASASWWFHYKTLLWNFKYCRVQMKKVSYWLSSKQSVSNHVSLYHDMRFLLAFP